MKEEEEEEREKKEEKRTNCVNLSCETMQRHLMIFKSTFGRSIKSQSFNPPHECIHKSSKWCFREMRIKTKTIKKVEKSFQRKLPINQCMDRTRAINWRLAAVY